MAASGERKEGQALEERYRRAALAHPLRRAILARMSGGWKASAAEIAAAFGEAPARVAYHLRVLARRGAVKVEARGAGLAALYRRSPHAHWVRKMLDGDDRPEPR